MNGTINAGDRCVVSRDIVINGVVAFRQGEQVTVEILSPNASRPEYPYVVFSKVFNNRFLLCDADLIRISEPAADSSGYGTVGVGAAPTTPSPATGKKSNRVYAVIGIIVFGLFLGVGGWAIYHFVVQGDGSESTPSSSVEKSTTSGGSEVSVTSGKVVHSPSPDALGRTIWGCEVTVTNNSDNTVDELESWFSAASITTKAAGELASIQTIDPTAVDLRGKLESGGKKTGWIAFAIPESESGGTFKFTSPASGSTNEWQVLKP